MNEQDKPRRMFIGEISASALAQLLQLPEGVIIEQMMVNPVELGVLRFRAVGAGWEVREGCMIPQAVGKATRQSMNGADGQRDVLTIEWGLPDEDAA